MYLVEVSRWVLWTVSTGFRSDLVLSISMSVSRSKIVERSMLSTVSVIVVCNVSTKSVPGPDTVVEN